MPIIREVKPKVVDLPTKVEPIKTPQLEVPAVLLEQLQKQNIIIREMLQNISGQRVINAKVVRNKQGFIDSIHMTVEASKLEKRN